MATMDVPLSILATMIVLATLGYSMQQSRQERFQSLQDKFRRDARFIPRGDQWHIDRRRGIGMGRTNYSP